MLISEFSNRENILAYVAKELRNIGVKIRHEKTKSVHVRNLHLFTFPKDQIYPLIYFISAE